MNCICEKCEKEIDYKNRVRITVYEFEKDPQCSGSRNKTIDGFSLCRECYSAYKKHTIIFFN